MLCSATRDNSRPVQFSPTYVSLPRSSNRPPSARSDSAHLELQKNLVFLTGGTTITILAVPSRDSAIRREAEQSKGKVGHVVELLQ